MSYYSVLKLSTVTCENDMRELYHMCAVFAFQNVGLCVIAVVIACDQ